MPGIGVEEVRGLIDCACQTHARIVTAATENQADPKKNDLQPLCTVVHNSVASDIQKAIDNRRLSVTRLWQEWGAYPVCFGDRARFTNINTPGDWEAWLHRHKESSHG